MRAEARRMHATHHHYALLLPSSQRCKNFCRRMSRRLVRATVECTKAACTAAAPGLQYLSIHCRRAWPSSTMCKQAKTRRPGA